MKLHLSLLKKFVSLTVEDPESVAYLLNDLGLEVKQLELLDGGADAIFTLELLANRGDHHGVLGMAREIASRNLGAVMSPTLASLETNRPISMPVRVNTSKCLTYLALELELPDYLRLRSEIATLLVGAPKHPLVDTLNHVQYELGQPLHAFDRDLLSGELRVEELEQEVEIEALDNQLYRVPVGSVVICDAKKIVAVAGVIGCSNSCVSATTKRAVIESAAFEPLSVRKTARAMGISTDASKVFERGSDFEMPYVALRRLLYLLAGAGGATAGGSCRVVGFNKFIGHKNELPQVLVSFAAIQAAVNLPRLPEFEVIKRLSILGFQVEFRKKEKDFKVIVPSWRIWDIEHEQDLVEEFVRSYGFSKIKTKGFKIDVTPLAYEPFVRDYASLAGILRSNGFNEIVTKAFYSEQQVGWLSECGIDSALHVRLQNAIEKANSALRVSLVPHFLSVIAQNQARDEQAIKIYEISQIFQKDSAANKACESAKVCFAWVGNWSERSRADDLCLVDRALLFKGVFESLLQEFGIKAQFGEAESGLLHPGIGAQAVVGRRLLGFLGALHPSLCRAAKVKGMVFYAELDLQAFLDCRERQSYIEPPRFPGVKRDLTVFLKPEQSAGSVLQKFVKLGLDHCESVSIHDWFRKVDEDFVRVTYRFAFRDVARTLAGDEVDVLIGKVRQFAEGKLGLALV